MSDQDDRFGLRTYLTPEEAKEFHKLFVSSFVGFTAIAANLAQYALTNQPWFGGMSGVVYGFLGYCWIDGRFNPRAGYRLNQQTVIIMLGWYAACWTGLLGPIANWAHTAGLAVGVAWAFADVQQRKNSAAR